MTTQSETPGERLAREKAEKQADFDAAAAPFRREAEAKFAREKAERAAAETAKAERLAAAQAAEFDRRYKTGAGVAYRATGGSQEDFEREWPRLREAIRTDLVRKAASAEAEAPKRNMF